MYAILHLFKPKYISMKDYSRHCMIYIVKADSPIVTTCQWVRIVIMEKARLVSPQVCYDVIEIIKCLFFCPHKYYSNPSWKTLFLATNGDYVREPQLSKCRDWLHVAWPNCYNCHATPRHKNQGKLPTRKQKEGKIQSIVPTATR